MVQELPATLPPSALHAAFHSPVLPPGLPCTEATPMPAQELVLSFPSPHRSRLSLIISLTGPNTVRTLPLSHMPFPFLDWATLPPKERLRLDHLHRYGPPSARRPTTGHRS